MVLLVFCKVSNLSQQNCSQNFLTTRKNESNFIRYSPLLEIEMNP